MIEQILMISLWCLGFNRAVDNVIWYLSDRRMGLDELDTDLYEKKGFFGRVIYFVAKPYILCVVCYASVHGSIIYWVAYGDSIENWIFVCVCVAFVNALFSRLYSWLQ